jgi:hypothetical protein
MSHRMSRATRRRVRSRVTTTSDDDARLPRTRVIGRFFFVTRPRRTGTL